MPDIYGEDAIAFVLDSDDEASRNGILEVTIPKLPEIQARRISVEAA